LVRRVWRFPFLSPGDCGFSPRCLYDSKSGFAQLAPRPGLKAPFLNSKKKDGVSGKFIPQSFLRQIPPSGTPWFDQRRLLSPSPPNLERGRLYARGGAPYAGQLAPLKDTALPRQTPASRLSSLGLLLPYMRPYRGRVLAAMAALLLAAGLLLGIGQGLRQLIDRGFAAGDMLPTSTRRRW
jgi:hypothetical protein